MYTLDLIIRNLKVNCIFHLRHIAKLFKCEYDFRDIVNSYIFELVKVTFCRLQSYQMIIFFMNKFVEDLVLVQSSAHIETK